MPYKCIITLPAMYQDLIVPSASTLVKICDYGSEVFQPDKIIPDVSSF